MRIIGGVSGGRGRGVVALAVAVALAVSLGGCKEDDRETLSSVYLEADGEAAWSILEWDIEPGRSGPENERRGLEKDFAASVRSNGYPLEVALDLAGALDSTTTFLKDDPPFEVHTLAHFRELGELFGGVYRAAGMVCESRLEREGSVRRWTLTVGGGEDSTEVNPAVSALIEAFGQMRIVLRTGRFVEARGFQIVDERTAAALEDEKDVPVDGAGMRVYALTWDTAQR